MAGSVALLIYTYSFIFLCTLSHRNISEHLICCHSLAINVQIPVLSPVNIHMYVIDSPVQHF